MMDDAGEQFAVALGFDSDFYLARHNPGTVYEAKGDWQRAKAAYDQAPSLNPNYLPAQRVLERIGGF